MFQKLLSILLIVSVFLSITGYTIPCTLHCLHSHTGMFHMHDKGETSHDHHHNQETDMDCKGSCSTEHLMNRPSNQQQDSPPNAMNLSQYLSKLLVAHFAKKLTFNPSSTKQFFNYRYLFSDPSWYPEPVSPPPQY